RRGRHARPPHCLRDVLDPAPRHPGQIHLDQRLLHRALAPPIALDDSRLERLLAQLRHPQPYLASLGLQPALVVASAAIATRLAALIPLRIAQPICLGIEQGVQRFLHCPRTTRSRWLLIRSSSIVMTLFSGLGVSSDMAAPSCWPGCV